MARHHAALISAVAAAAGLVAASRAVPPIEARPLAAFHRNDVIPAPKVDFARVADFDGDRDPDFLAVESTGSNLDWYENADPDGLRFVRHPISASSGGVAIASPGDADGDGDMDIFALPANGRVEVWQNDGHGAFAKLQQTTLVVNANFIEAADVNGDHLADFFAIDSAANDIDWWANDPAMPGRHFQEVRVTTSAATDGNVERLDAADLDRDGLVDFVTANPSAGRITWWRHTVDGQGRHQFASVLPGTGLREEQVKDVSAADIDGDGDIDLFALRMMPYEVWEWQRQADGSFTRLPQALAKAPNDSVMWDSVDQADVNGDAAVDFIVAEPGTGGRLCWYENPAIIDVGTATPSPTPDGIGRTATATATATDTATVPGPPTRTTTATRTPYGQRSATPSPTDPGSGPTSTATRTATRPPDLRFHVHLPFAAHRH